MSNSTDTTGCISHRRHTRFFVMYEDFLDVAKVSEHQYKLAAFWRVLETKTNDRITSIPEIVEDCKKKGIPIPEEHLWVEIPYSEFVNRALGTYKSSSFQVAAAESERLGFSKSRQLQRRMRPNDPNSPMEDYKEYLFLSDVMQSVLNGGEYPTPIEINSPLLKSIAVRKQTKKDQKKKTAIENNTPPIEINSPPTETPIEINSPPLLNSIGNKYISKDSNNEGKNECPPNEKISQGDALTHSSTQPSEISFSSEEETVYELASQLNLSYLKKNEKNKAHCSKLIKKGVKTLEQMQSLKQFCKQRDYLKDKDLNLGNLAGEVDGWLQLQEQPTPEQTRPQPSQAKGSQQPVVSVLLSEEKKKRNLERLRQKAIAAGYQE